MDRFHGTGCYACDRSLNQDTREWTSFSSEPAKYRCHKCRKTLITLQSCTQEGPVQLEQHYIVWNYQTPIRMCQECRTRDYMDINTKQGCWMCSTQCNPKDRHLVVYVDNSNVNVRFTACSEKHFDELLAILMRTRRGWCSKCNLLHCEEGPRCISLEVMRRTRKDISSWLNSGAWNTWLASWRNSTVIWNVEKYTATMRQY